MADTTAHETINGFRVNYNCPDCGHPIKSYYYWNAFASITKPYDIAIGL